MTLVRASLDRLHSVGKSKVAVAVESSAPPCENKRRSNRRSGRSPGLIYPGGMAATIPCLVVDQSINGARLKMQPGWVNPFHGRSSVGQHFTLVMRLDRVEVDCEIVRIEENEIGVRFLSILRQIARK